MAQTHDIEDVLSSIRRLVANEQAAIPIPSELEQGPMLLLDEEHRVTEPEDPFQTIQSLAQEEMDGRDAEHFVDDMTSDVTAITGDLVDLLPEEAKTSEAAEDQGAKPAPDESEPEITTSNSQSINFEAPPIVEPDMMMFGALSGFGIPGGSFSAPPEAAPEDPDIEAEIAAMLDAEDAALNEAEIDAQPEDESPAAIETPEPVIAEAEDVSETELWADVPEIVEGPEDAAPSEDVATPEEVTAAADEAPLENEAPHQEAAEVEDPADAEPTFGEVDLSGLDLSDLDLDAPMSDLAVGAATAAVAETVETEIDLSDLSDAGQSEEMLREMIAEIVRQELAGELGERITRNVRKLVRREMRQMMAAEDFD